MNKLNIDSIFVSQSLQEHSYLLDKELGHGGFGVVYLCQSIKYHRPFAVKVIYDPKCTSPINCHEISSMLKVGFDNIILIYDFWQDSDYLFLILEYCPTSLKDKIHKPNTTFPLEDWNNIFKQIVCAVDHCHDVGYAHLDIKPGNILFDSFGRAKLADFGLCSIQNDNDSQKLGIGTKEYMAPEMILKNCTNLFAADVWSLGILLYEMTYGQKPFPKNSHPKMIQAILDVAIEFPYGGNAIVKRLIRQMTVRNPSERISLKGVLNSPLFNTKNASFEIHSSRKLKGAGSLSLIKPIRSMCFKPNNSVTKQVSIETFQNDINFEEFISLAKKTIAAPTVTF